MYLCVNYTIILSKGATHEFVVIAMFLRNLNVRDFRVIGTKTVRYAAWYNKLLSYHIILIYYHIHKHTFL